jgi:hypothetical protein
MAGWFKRSGKVTAETARRITGISTPLGGISWGDPGPGDGETVRRFLLFLEDRRALYNAMNLEVVGEVHRSIHEIREQCTKTLQASRLRLSPLCRCARSARQAGAFMMTKTSGFASSTPVGVTLREGRDFLWRSAPIARPWGTRSRFSRLTMTSTSRAISRQPCQPLTDKSHATGRRAQ